MSKKLAFLCKLVYNIKTIINLYLKGLAVAYVTV